jgi:hypothetical protein
MHRVRVERRDRGIEMTKERDEWKEAARLETETRWRMDERYDDDKEVSDRKRQRSDRIASFVNYVASAAVGAAVGALVSWALSRRDNQ